jgi:hypothetical protein
MPCKPEFLHPCLTIPDSIRHSQTETTWQRSYTNPFYEIALGKPADFPFHPAIQDHITSLIITLKLNNPFLRTCPILFKTWPAANIPPYTITPLTNDPTKQDKIRHSITDRFHIYTITNLEGIKGLRLTCNFTGDQTDNLMTIRDDHKDVWLLQIYGHTHGSHIYQSIPIRCIHTFNNN